MHKPERPAGSDRFFDSLTPPRPTSAHEQLAAQLNAWLEAAAASLSSSSSSASPDHSVSEDQPHQQHDEAAIPTPPRPALPRWHVILRQQDWYELSQVVDAIVDLTPLGEGIAVQRMFESHYTGSAFLLSTHRERAELYQTQFADHQLVVRIEPAQ